MPRATRRNHRKDAVLDGIFTGFSGKTVFSG